MAANRITDKIYSVGVQNPDLRIFDIVMETKYGTSYNSYIVKGDDVALIEASHADFKGEYEANIREVADPAKIKYIVLNHTEPDHSGALADLLRLCPDATVLATAVALNYLKNIVNEPFKSRPVKDGEVLDLGGVTLTFTVAPLLHWPDSMFTYCAEEKVLFSCDVFGSHYSSEKVFDKDVENVDGYKEAFKGYYDAIFGPFKPFVIAGTAKIAKYPFETVCPSHGPVLTKNGLLPYVLDCYKNWSKPVKNAVKTIPVFYCSAYGCTSKLAEAIAEGVKEVIPDAACETYNLIENDMSEMRAKINSCDACAIGSPTLNSDAVPPVWDLLAGVDAINSRKKPVAVFGSYGWSGEAVPNVIARVSGLKMAVVGEGLKVCFVPTAADIESAKEYGRQLAGALK